MITAFALVRAAHYLSLMLIFGAESLRALLKRALPVPPPHALHEEVFRWAAATAFGTSLIWFALTAVQVTGSFDAAFSADTWRAMVTATEFGPVLLARVAATGFLVAAVFVPGTARARILLSGFALADIALTSHAAASGPDYTALRTANDAIHLVAAGFWMGALAELLALALVLRREPRALVAPLKTFSSWGTLAVALLIAAGTLNGVMILYAAPSLWSWAYLTLLAAKIVLAGLMVALALANRFSLVPGIHAGRAEAEHNLLGSLIAELTTGAIVVVIVGFLGIMSPLLR